MYGAGWQSTTGIDFMTIVVCGVHHCRPTTVSFALTTPWVGRKKTSSQKTKPGRRESGMLRAYVRTYEIVHNVISNNDDLICM